jgi:hypothetical protein
MPKKPRAKRGSLAPSLHRATRPSKSSSMPTGSSPSLGSSRINNSGWRAKASRSASFVRIPLESDLTLPSKAGLNNSEIYRGKPNTDDFHRRLAPRQQRLVCDRPLANHLPALRMGLAYSSLNVVAGSIFAIFRAGTMVASMVTRIIPRTTVAKVRAS